ncbi:MAG: hypothetical protein U5K79_08635 [Cyclobacteriaceae bacterium]|nr:hypothetical protein [Cyclobacteriaceae bacterium]
MALFGVAICQIGIVFSGKAGMMKEREISKEEKVKSVKDFSLVKGLVVATVSGILVHFATMVLKRENLWQPPLLQQGMIRSIKIM